MNIYLTEKSKFVIRQESVGFIQEEISPDKLFKAPVFALDKPVGSLAFCNKKKSMLFSDSAAFKCFQVAVEHACDDVLGTRTYPLLLSPLV